jgi:hypothetical protein
MSQVYYSWMDRKWLAAIRERFADRQDIGRDHVYELYFASQGLPKQEVFEFFDLVESDYGAIGGLLRPEDRLDEKFFKPVPSRNPFRSAEYEVKAGDRQLNFGDELIRQMKKHGTYAGEPLPRMETIEDFVSVWCGRMPDYKSVKLPSMFESQA